ncbi:hypothetical protein L484_016751 [Morus notabilis]|uniref:Uncharacterized protein n=1 Tax=Morus notabilis TaxID=981085 RepID=W9R3M6_9ROSA|nr:hypothetical protein L484_016751 [Morus notabilis]
MAGLKRFLLFRRSVLIPFLRNGGPLIQVVLSLYSIPSEWQDERVQPFLGFVESGFPFTHNGGAAPTRQAATGHKALFAQQIHFDSTYKGPV